MRRIVITAGDVRAEATLNDSPTADALWEVLPIEAAGNVWGEEIYFGIPLAAPEAPDARQDMEIGEIAFWPPGTAFCIFFGPTPVSKTGKPRAYSPVNVLGKVEGDATVFRAVKDGAMVTLARAESGGS
jgi:hypothetical protein